MFKFLPVFFNNEFYDRRKSIVTVVIPGAVSQERRDYQHILSKIITFKKKTHFRFVFLGKAHGKELLRLQDFEKNKPENVSVKYFTEKVPQNIFDEWMSKADILWCPIQSETEFFSNKEFYGITKISGNIGDAIKYGKPAVFPENYPNSHPFILPENSNIEEQLFTSQKWMDYDFQQEFNKRKISEDLEKALNNLI